MVTRFKYWFYLKDCLFGGVKLTKNTDPEKFVYSGYGSVGKNVIIFGVDMISSVHFDNKRKDILVFRKSQTQGIYDTTLTAEACIIIGG